MSERTTKASLPSITARPSAAEKARFTWLADRVGMSESELALLAIRSFIDPDGKTPPSITQAMERLAATDRMTIRLRPGDGTTIAQRAAARGMKASAYVAALVRSHVGANPPLPAAELAALKQSVEVLGGLGHALDRLERSHALTAADREALWKDIARIQLVLAGLEQQTIAPRPSCGSRASPPTRRHGPCGDEARGLRGTVAIAPGSGETRERSARRPKTSPES